MSIFPWNFMPLVSFPALTSRQGMILLLSIASSPAAEVGEDREPRPAALLRVELDRDEIPAGDGGAETDPVFGPPGRPGLIRRGRVVGVDEKEFRPFRDSGEDRVVLTEGHPVPPHVGDFQPLPAASKVRREAPDLSGDEAKAVRVVLLAW